MIIYFNNKTGKIYGAILGRVHNEFEKKPNLIRPKGVKYADMSRKILNLKDSIAVEEYLEGNQLKILDCEVVLDKDPDYLFIRRKTQEVEPQKPDAVDTLIVDLTKSEEEIIAGYSETTRRWLKKASEVYMTFREIGFEELQKVRDVLEELEDIKDIKLAKHILGVRSAFLDGMRRAYIVEDEKGKPIAAAVITATRNTFKYTLGGVAASGRELHAGDFLMHNLILDAKSLGYKEFDLGGIYADWADDEKKEVNNFKKRWGGKTAKLI